MVKRDKKKEIIIDLTEGDSVELTLPGELKGKVERAAHDPEHEDYYTTPDPQSRTTIRILKKYKNVGGNFGALTPIEKAKASLMTRIDNIAIFCSNNMVKKKTADAAMQGDMSHLRPVTLVYRDNDYHCSYAKADTGEYDLKEIKRYIRGLVTSNDNDIAILKTLFLIGSDVRDLIEHYNATFRNEYGNEAYEGDSNVYGNLFVPVYYTYDHDADSLLYKLRAANRTIWKYSQMDKAELNDGDLKFMSRRDEFEALRLQIIENNKPIGAYYMYDEAMALAKDINILKQTVSAEIAALNNTIQRRVDLLFPDIDIERCADIEGPVPAFVIGSGETGETGETQSSKALQSKIQNGESGGMAKDNAVSNKEIIGIDFALMGKDVSHAQLAYICHYAEAAKELQSLGENGTMTQRRTTLLHQINKQNGRRYDLATFTNEYNSSKTVSFKDTDDSRRRPQLLKDISMVLKTLQGLGLERAYALAYKDAIAIPDVIS